MGHGREESFLTPFYCVAYSYYSFSVCAASPPGISQWQVLFVCGLPKQIMHNLSYSGLCCCCPLSPFANPLYREHVQTRKAGREISCQHLLLGSHHKWSLPPSRPIGSRHGSVGNHLVGGALVLYHSCEVTVCSLWG